VGLTPEDWRKSSSRGKSLYGCAIGYLEYKRAGAQARSPFATLAWLSGSLVAPARESSAEYNLFFEAGRAGYVVDLPISNFKRPSEPSRSSSAQTCRPSFTFDVAVAFTDGPRLDLGTVELDYFRPKVAKNWRDDKYTGEERWALGSAKRDDEAK
jgi:hypothetical protein